MTKPGQPAVTPILVVDDNPDILHATLRILSGAGYEAHGADTGEGGLRSAAELHPFLILLDVDLPDIDGREVCRRIKSDPVLKTILVVMVSNTRTSSDDQAAGLDDGADGYIVRPVANRELLSRVAAFRRIHETEAALRASEENLLHYRLLAENSRDVILFIRNADRRIIEANRAAVAAYGYSRDELLGLTIADLRAPDSRAEIGRQFAVADTEGILFETRHTRRNGETLSVEVSSRGMTQNNERVILSIVRDISDRVREREALERREREFQTLVQNLPDIVIRYDREHRIVFVNEAQSVKSGMPVSWYIGKANSELPLPENLVRLLDDCIGRVFSTGTLVKTGFTITTTDSPLFFESIIVPEFDSGGRFETVLSVSRDVTELRSVESALAESLEKYRSLIENSPNAICRWKPDDLTLTYVNEVYARLRGRGSGELIGTSWLDSIPESERGFVLDRVHHAVRNSETVTLDNTVASESGSTKVLQWTDIPIHAPDGSVFEFQSVGVDITSRVQKEKNQELVGKILESMTLFGERGEIIHRILNLIRDYTEVDAIGIRLRDGENCPYFDSLGLPERIIACGEIPCAPSGSDCSGTTCLCEAVIQGIFKPDSDSTTQNGSFWTDSLGTLAREGVDPGLPIQLRNICGEEGFESLALIPLRLDGRIIGLLQLNDRRMARFTREQILFMESLGTTVGLIIEKSRLHDTIRSINGDLERKFRGRTAELAAANRELETFSYSVSHDLKAPLRRISGFASMLQAELAGSLDEKSTHYIDVITKSCHDLRVLIDGLLVFSRVVGSSLQAATIILNRLVREVLGQFEAEIAERKLRCVVGDLPVVRGDAVLLSTVFSNLVSNAIKFTNGCAQPVLEIGSRHENGEMIIFVRDNGAGFDMEYAQRLFKPFQRLHSGSEFEGSGIGLATVRRIIERHGGRVWAEGRPGAGATFYFTLTAFSDNSGGL